MSAELLQGPASLKTKGGEWAAAVVGPISFAGGGIIEAGSEPAAVRAPCGAVLVELRLGAGGRLSRRSPSAFDLWAGSVRVRAQKLTDRLVMFHGYSFVEVQKLGQDVVAFEAVVVGNEWEISVSEGELLVHASGATERELHFVSLSAGERTLAAGGAKPVKHDVEEAAKGAFLSPVVSLAFDRSSVGAADPLLVHATVKAGVHGAFEGILFAGPQVPFIAYAVGSGKEQEIPLGVTEWRGDGEPPESVVAEGERTFQVTFEVGAHGLTPGVWKVRLRYRSYEEHADGSVWIGSVTSDPVALEVTK